MTTLPKAVVHVIAIAFLSLSCKCNRNFCDLRHVTDEKLDASVQQPKDNTTKHHILFLWRTMQ